MHEQSLYEDNCYLTLTYSPEHIPINNNLNKTHFQKFIKKLRKKHTPLNPYRHIRKQSKQNNNKYLQYKKENAIRYYMCGEYGEESGRPHYHAVIFNYRPSDLVQRSKNHNGDILFESEELTKVWGLGHVTVGDVTWQSAAYVARYVMKKVTGDLAHEHYQRVDAETGEIIHLPPEYNAMSRNPGIGKEWFEKYNSDVFPDDFCIDHNGKKVKTPNYYLKQLEEKDPLLWDEIKFKRQQGVEKFSKELTLERLAVREKCHQARINQLKRKL